MATNLQQYSQLADFTAQKITGSYQSWTDFLTTAARLYKYPYHEQLMIYAQRPEATACADYELWNKRMGRYIRRGAKGIALIDHSGDTPKLKYVFDVADTRTKEHSRSPYLWEYHPEHEQVVSAALEEQFAISNDGDFAEQLHQISGVKVAEYYLAHQQDILGIVDGSYLERYHEYDKGVAFLNAATVSTTYTLLSRCGLDADAYFGPEDFIPVFDFNTPQAVSALGSAVSEISESVLRSIEVTIKRYEREKLSERSQDYERTDLHPQRGLLDSQSEPVPAGDAASGQVREDAQEISSGAPSGAVEQPDSVREAVSPSEGDRRNGEQPVRADDARADAVGGSDGSSEGQRPHEMGGPDEQPESPGRGSDPGGADLRLTDEPPIRGEQVSFFPTEAEQIAYITEAESAEIAPSAFSMPQEYIDQFLRVGSNTEDHRTRIAIAYAKQKPMDYLVDFLEKTYHGGYGLQFGTAKVCAWYAEDGMHLAYGSTARYARNAQILSWEDVTARIGALLELGQFATNVELAEMRGFERKKLADSLWYMKQDMSEKAMDAGYMSIVRSLRGGFPEETEKLRLLLSEPESYQAIMRQVYTFRDACNADKGMMRFQMYNPNNLIRPLEEYVLPRREYVSEMAETPEEHPFITEDEIEDALSGGSNVEGSSGRIYDFYQSPHTSKEKLDFLKDEYGTGGGNVALSHNFWSDKWYDSKGIQYDKPGCARVELSWKKVVKYIDALMESGRYLTPEALAKKQERDAKQAADKLAALEPKRPAREITQADIDEALQKWNGSIDSKRSVVRYMEAHGRERDTSQWLAREYGADPAQPLRIAVAGADGETVLPWPKVQCRIAQLIKEDRFYTEEEHDNFDDIDPAAIREELEARGIVGGQVVDPEKLDNDPFIQQVTADVEQIAAEEVAAATQTEQEEQPVRLTPEEELDRNPISIQINGQWQTFPNARAAEEASEAEYRDSLRRNARNFHITDDNLGVGGAKAKYQANIAAIKLLKELESEGLQASPEQQEVLSRYVGWGGLPDAFDPSKENWGKEYTELQELLTSAEYEAARASTLNAHYTSPTVIRAIYEAVGNMGFQTGNILEPSMGVGNFFGMLPEEMGNSRLYGVELDSITGRIAKQLYPKANITVAGFETTDRRDFFDLAVGNVPFGQYKVNDPAYNKLGFNIHNYFFAKALDQVRPGGAVAFVTSRYTMDAKDSTVRRYLAQRADLLGAIRLPNTAFKANAGTEVVSDILFLQKRDRPIEIDPDWVHLGQTEDGYAINSFFLEHPEMVMGRNSSESTAHGMDYTVEPLEDISLADQLHEAVQHIHGTYQEAELPDLGEGETVQNTLPADPDVKNFSYTLVGGEVYFRENSIMVKPDLNTTAKERIKGMLALSTCVHELIDLQMNETIPDSAIREKQGELNQLYDSFTGKYGLINSRGNKLAFSDDSSYFLLCALEVMDDDGNFQRKADMFTKRTIQPHRVVTSVDTASEALTLSIAEKAAVDMEYMSSLTGKTAEELASELHGVIFHDPTLGNAEDGMGWVTADEYLSGNVRQKLRQAEAAAADDPAYQVNVEALRAAQPKDLDASEIEVRLGTTWIDKAYIKQFMFETFDTPFYSRSAIDVQYSPYTAAWNISGKTRISDNDIAAWNTYGTSCVSAYEILEDSLNLRDVQVYDTIEDADGKKKRVLNARETTLASQKQQLIRDAFKDWIWADPQRRQALVRQYNEEMNSTRPREYDGSHIVFAGMNPEITLREHQRNAIAHVLYGGNTLLAHEVGAGKTFEMVAAAMESKRLGLCQKSIFAVPNHLTEQWASEFLRLYPSANILVTKQRDFETKNRKKFCARIATGDYDAVIIGHSQFEKIPISQERQERLLQDQIAEITMGISELKASGGEKFSVKELERTKRGLESRLEKLRADGKKDDVVTFEELGVDRMFVDEAHNYKNLFLYTKMRNVAGLSTTDAQKSSDMFAKCRYMDELTGSRGVVFATGTPVSNSMTELYTMQRYLQYARLEEMRMTHFDCWASRFGETVTALELAPEGKGYRPRTRFSRFFNLPELMNLFKEVADIKTADQLHLPVPEVEYHNVVAKPTEVQKGLVHQLSERAAAIHSGNVDPSTDNMLKVTSDGRKLGLDQRIINPGFPDQDGSKVNLCVENILQVWKDGESDKLTQLVFCDISTPQSAPKTQKAVCTVLGDSLPDIAALSEEAAPSFTVYDDIRSKLIAGGIPTEQIAFIHDANTEVKKKELFGKVRSGQVRVLLGSTAKMGAGTNVQDRLVAIHDLDCPWRPGDLQQRKGRIECQGNQNEKVHVFRYVTEGTFDAYLWQTVENKQKFISQIMTSKSPVRSCNDVDETALSFAEIKALCAGDPRIKERMDLDVEVSKLKIMKADYKSKQYRLEDNLMRHFPEQIGKLKGCIQAIQEDMQTLEAHPHPKDGFAGMTVLADHLVDKDSAGAALIEAAKKATGYDPVEVGTYRGFQMSVTLEDFGKKYVLTMQGKLRHQATLGSDPRGNLIRLDNALAQMPQRLKTFQTQLEETYHQQEAAKVELAKPFPFEEELRDKAARLIFLDAELNLDANKGGQPEQVVAKAVRPSVLDKLRSQPAPSRNDRKQKHHEEVR